MSLLKFLKVQKTIITRLCLSKKVCFMFQGLQSGARSTDTEIQGLWIRVVYQKSGKYRAHRLKSAQTDQRS